ncbi:homeobox-leucine zipper protein ATHB-12-like [Coffea eugenioides]|uniref:homeobox-leucine zipper protein ATHB-12-like n=1 Tax=Coffea eugenioides TaxID=49369 RepID=UPI000F6096EA|nr:homeobox-leucine zipper protein ATHB-12-like [Coffea eugenioides]
MEQTGYFEQERWKPSNKHSPFPIPKRKRRNNAKRFSDEQVKSLESMFNREAKLEPMNKMQLAKDLGLQPRQVSIWFQNKRARWKSKKLEQEYRVLKANFDALCHQFEALKKENESLLEQLHTLNGVLENSNKRQSSSKDSNENAEHTAPPKRDEHPERREDDERTTKVNVDGVGVNEHFGKEDQANFDILTEQGESTSASRKPWCNLVSDGLLDESCCPSSWWDFSDGLC